MDTQTMLQVILSISAASQVLVIAGDIYKDISDGVYKERNEYRKSNAASDFAAKYDNLKCRIEKIIPENKELQEKIFADAIDTDSASYTFKGDEYSQNRVDLVKMQFMISQYDEADIDERGIYKKNKENTESNIDVRATKKATNFLWDDENTIIEEIHNRCKKLGLQQNEYGRYE